MSFKSSLTAFLGIVLISFTASKSYSNNTFHTTKSTLVWICTSENSYAYHYDNTCHALKRCKVEKKQVSLTDAQGKYERKLCGFED